MFAVLASSANVCAHEEKAFLSYMRETNNFFAGDEYHFRLGVFLQNKRYVQDFNRAGKSFTLALNKFAHLTQTEYEALLGAKPDFEFHDVKETKVEAPVNEECDWRKKGVVNPVKDQAQCGSCWAFSVIQCQESVFAIKNPGKLYVLSEQNLVDCVTSCYGCDGGWPYKTFDYVIKKQQGLFNLESDYPYTARDGKCQFDASKGVAKVTNYVSVKSYNEADLAKKIQDMGPASICIDAGQSTFRLYHEGIYDDPKCNKYRLNHAVGCVGFGSEGGRNYWIVRNSWAADWGMEGYVRIAKDEGNVCGVATSAIIPTD